LLLAGAACAATGPEYRQVICGASAHNDHVPLPDACRNRTTYASKYPDIAWRNWLLRYNVSYDNATEAAYRRSIFDYSLALAKQLNELAGPEVAVSDRSESWR
jgi:hypothetical protein